MRLVDWLERQNIRCEIIAFRTNQCSLVEVMVKQAYDPLDLDALAIVTHTDFYRRLIFRLDEISKTFVYTHGGSIMKKHGRMHVPPMDGNGFLIYSENADYASEVDRSFDDLEKRIEKTIEDGEANAEFAL